MEQITVCLPEEVGMTVPGNEVYLVLQINPAAGYKILCKISGSCTADKHKKIEKVIPDNAAVLNLPATSDE